MSVQWNNSRDLVERIIVTGTLVLETPAHFGNGDGDGLLDMPLHLDTYEGRALLAGTSLAGALRDYVTRHVARRPQPLVDPNDGNLAQKLFGYVYDEDGARQADSDEDNRKRSEESLVIVDDALGDQQPTTELRDGVAIDPKTRTAEDDKKFDIELLAVGTSFSLSLELLVRKDKDNGEDREALIQLFALALHGLASGKIRLGKRKRRGFGRCRVAEWTVHRFDMQSPQGMIDWLRYDPDAQSPPAVTQPAIQEADIFVALNVDPIALPKPAFTLNATFRLDGSLLIRSAPDATDAADAVHLRAKNKNGKSSKKERGTPILSGTSAAGALRARALRIVNTLAHAQDRAAQVHTDQVAADTQSGTLPANKIVDTLFGYRVKPKERIDGNQDADKTPLWASRLWVDETKIKEPLPLVHTRVKIDRFTGGSFPGALFSNEPIWGTRQTKVQLRLTLDDWIEPPQIPLNGDEPDLPTEPELYKPNVNAEIGLLLLLLKDLWTGDLPLGGESSVGRGRIVGELATIEIGDDSWEIEADAENGLLITGGQSQLLETYVQALQTQIGTPNQEQNQEVLNEQ